MKAKLFSYVFISFIFTAREKPVWAESEMTVDG